MSEAKLRVMLVDDHPVIREGLALTIQVQADMEVVGEASTGEEAVEKVCGCRPDVVVIDLKMPGMGGRNAIAMIRERAPETKIVVFTTFGNEEDVIPAVEAGADGYMLKGSTSTEILQAIRAVARGNAPIDPAVAKVLLGQVGKTKDFESALLSDRELEVLRLIAQGMRNKEIAFELYITEKTVKAHVGNILAKLNVVDRTAAVTTALKRGLIEL